MTYREKRDFWRARPGRGGGVVVLPSFSFGRKAQLVSAPDNQDSKCYGDTLELYMLPFCTEKHSSELVLHEESAATHLKILKDLVYVE